MTKATLSDVDPRESMPGSWLQQKIVHLLQRCLSVVHQPFHPPCLLPCYLLAGMKLPQKLSQKLQAACSATRPVLLHPLTFPSNLSHLPVVRYKLCQA